MAPTPAGSGSPTRPSVVLSLGEPELSAVMDSLIEADFDVIPLDPETTLAEVFSPSVQSVVAVVDVAADPAGAVATVAKARRGRQHGLAVLYVAGDHELDGLEAAGVDGADEIVLRPLSVDALRWRVEAMAIRAQVPTDSETSDAVLSGGRIDAGWVSSAPVFVLSAAYRESVPCR